MERDTVTENAPAGNGVESNEGNLTHHEMMGMFLQEAEATDEVSADAPEGDEQATAPEGEEPDSGTEEVEAEESDPEPEEGEDDDDVLSELKPNAAKRARKRIDKLTARAKEAEERLQQREQEFQQMQERLAKLEQGDQQQERQQMRFVERAKSAEDPAELQEIYNTAIATRDWVDDHIDDDTPELNGQEIDRDTMKAMRKEAREIIERVIPERTNYIRQREQFDQNTYRDFPAWRDPQNPDYKLLQDVWSDPLAKDTFHKMPNGRYLASVFVEGLKAMQNRGKKEKSEAETPKQQPRKQQIAPRVPGSDDGYSPSPGQQGSDFEKQFQQKETLSQEDLVAYFASKERAKRNQS